MDSGRNYSGVVMFSVGTVNLGRVPVSGVVHTGLEIVRHQHNGSTTEILKHIHMDLVFHIHPETGFRISIHTEGQNTNKQINQNCFAVSLSMMYSLSPAQSTSIRSPVFPGMCMVALSFSAYFWKWKQNWEYMTGCSLSWWHSSQYSIQSSLRNTSLQERSLYTFSKSGIRRSNTCFCFSGNSSNLRLAALAH